MATKIIQIIPANPDTYFRAHNSLGAKQAVLIHAFGLTDEGKVLPLQSNVNYTLQACLIPINEAGRIILGKEV